MKLKYLKSGKQKKKKKLTIGQLKYRYRQIAKEKFQGKVYINKDTNKDINKEIKISGDGIMECWRKSRRREHIISVQLLDYFLENGIFIEEKPDYLGRRKIQSASLFKSKCKINGKLYNIIFTTRKAIYDIDKFRYFSLKDIE